jgi:hypothetical protein
VGRSLNSSADRLLYLSKSSRNRFPQEFAELIGAGLSVPVSQRDDIAAAAARRWCMARFDRC